MKIVKSKLLAAIFAITIASSAGCDDAVPAITNVVDPTAAAALAKVEAIKAQEEQDQALGQFIINMMYRTRAGEKLSAVKKQILARAIVRVANDVFEAFEHKKAFVIALSIESAFARTAQSPTGPRGYSQVAKKAFAEGMALCGAPDVHDEDVWETDINLYAGACYFRNLLETVEDPGIAIVHYNQGPNSEAARMYAKTGDLTQPEALRYVAKFNFLDRTVPVEKAPGVPAINELPQPGKTKGAEVSQ